jgi:hypothetical protein
MLSRGQSSTKPDYLIFLGFVVNFTVGCILPELETFIFSFLALKKMKKENLFSLLGYKMKPKFVNGLSFSISKVPNTPTISKRVELSLDL